MIILSFITGFSEKINWAQQGIDIKQGIVFTATVGVLSRIFIRTGIQTGVRSGIRTSLRSIFRNYLKTFVEESKEIKNPILKWVFNNPKNKNNHEQKFSGEFIRVCFTIAILGFSLLLVALLKPSSINEEHTAIHYPIQIRFISDIFALSIVLFFLFFTEKIYAEKVQKEDFLIYITPDGLLVQIIFALSLSYLPLVHDTEISSDNPKHRALMGLVGILTLILLFAFSFLVNKFIFSSVFLTSIQDIAILLSLLYSFPSKPYEGGDIFYWNKFWSLAIFSICVLLAIFYLSPEIVYLI
jgi:hypothetical protein